MGPEEAAAARSLFDEARTLIQAGKAAEACPKLEESQRLLPGIGTMFNLANCYEQVGRTASAWSMFLQTASMAKAAGQPERQEAARSRASDLEPRLSRLAIVVPAQSHVTGLAVARDGVEVGRGAWGSGIAVDPGVHMVTASAPGRASWQTRVSVVQPGATITVSVPTLSVEASSGAPGSGASTSASTSAIPAAREPARMPATRIAGFGAIGLGAVGLVVGTVYGLRRNSKQDDAKSHCLDYPTGCDATGLSANEDAASAGKIAVAGFVVGGVLAAAGVVLVLIPPSKSSQASGVKLAPLAGVRGGGLQLESTW